MPAPQPIASVPKTAQGYPTNATEWTAFTKWLLNVVNNIETSVSTGNDAGDAAAAAQVSANAAQATGNGAQTSATAANTAAGNAQATANAANALAATAQAGATAANASVVVINNEISLINGVLNPGISHTVTLAKITSGGANGSLTFHAGILIGVTDPT